MKTFIAALAAAMVAATSLAQAAPTTCLQSNLIDRTEVKDSQTLLFHMRDGKIWRNKLVAACPDLKFHGYVMNLGGQNEVCSNMQTIRILTTQESCMLGEFTPYTAQ